MKKGISPTVAIVVVAIVVVVVCAVGYFMFVKSDREQQTPEQMQGEMKSMQQKMQDQGMKAPPPTGGGG